MQAIYILSVIRVTTTTTLVVAGGAAAGAARAGGWVAAVVVAVSMVVVRIGVFVVHIALAKSSGGRAYSLSLSDSQLSLSWWT